MITYDRRQGLERSKLIMCSLTEYNNYIEYNENFTFERSVQRPKN